MKPHLDINLIADWFEVCEVCVRQFVEIRFHTKKTEFI